MNKLVETDRLFITEMTADMAMDVHKNSLDEDIRRFVPDEVFETPEEAEETALFCSFYYYSMTVLSQIPDILDKYGKFSKESKNLREEFTKH